MDVHQQRALGRVMKIFGEALSNAADEILKASVTGDKEPAEGGITGKPLVVPRTLHQEAGVEEDGDEKLNNVLTKRRVFGRSGQFQYLPSPSGAAKVTPRTVRPAVKKRKGSVDGRISDPAEGQRGTRRRAE